MSDTMQRIQKLRNGRGWYVCYPTTGIGDVYAYQPRLGTVVFRTRSDAENLNLACDFCERQNKIAKRNVWK